MNRQSQFVGSTAVMFLNDELRARQVSTVQSSMWDDPKDVIEAAIRSAFVSYPKDDDRDGRMCWIAPKECSQLAIGVILGLHAKGFQIPLCCRAPIQSVPQLCDRLLQPGSLSGRKRSPERIGL